MIEIPEIDQSIGTELTSDYRRHRKTILMATMIIILLIIASIYVTIQFEEWNKGNTAFEVIENANSYAREWNENATDH